MQSSVGVGACSGRLAKSLASCTCQPAKTSGIEPYHLPKGRGLAASLAKGRSDAMLALWDCRKQTCWINNLGRQFLPVTPGKSTCHLYGESQHSASAKDPCNSQFETGAENETGFFMRLSPEPEVHFTQLSNKKRPRPRPSPVRAQARPTG